MGVSVEPNAIQRNEAEELIHELQQVYMEDPGISSIAEQAG